MGRAVKAFVLADAVTYLREAKGSELTLVDLCRHYELSESAVRKRIFTAGLRFNDLLDQERDIRWKKAYRVGVRNASEVFEDLGFQSLGGFLTWFHRTYGVRWRHAHYIGFTNAASERPDLRKVKTLTLKLRRKRMKS